MTAAVYRNSTPALSVPQTQNTAPVLEFNCLYTHDIRRKAKRWQDGFLRYHTFNKRVMVYDVPRNYIGDTHWTSDGEVADGDELTLDKAGVLVQVAEAVGRTETDLTELRASTKKTRGDGSSPARAPQTPVVPRPSNAALSRQPNQLKHRSLNALLGSSRTPIGKAALPAKSPFELRHENAENKEWEEGRPPKRLRAETSAAWNVTRTTTAAQAPKKELPLWARTADAAKQRKKAQLRPGQQKLNTREVVDLREDGPSSDAWLPDLTSDTIAPLSSPQRNGTPAKRQPAAKSSSPAFRTQKVSGKLQDASFSRRAAAEERAAAMDDAINHAFIVLEDSDDHEEAAEQRKSPVKAAASAQNQASKQSIRARHAPPAATDRPQSSKSGSTLRIAASAPRKKLLCQDQITSQPKRISSTNTEAAAGRLLNTASDDEGSPPPGKAQNKFVQERLAKIREKEAAAARRPRADTQRARRVRSDKKDSTGTNRASAEMGCSSRIDPVNSKEVDEHGLELAALDQMILSSVSAARETTPIPHANDTRDNISAVEPHLSEPSSLPQSHANVDERNTETESPSKSATKQRAARKKVSKKEIRASAAACFKSPDLDSAPAQDDPSRAEDDCHDGPKQYNDVRGDVEDPVQSPSPPAQQHSRKAGQDERPSSDKASPAKPKRIPGAPMRFTPTPPKASRQSTPTESRSSAVDNNAPATMPADETVVHRDQPPAMPPPPRPIARPAPSKGQQKAVTLDTAASGTATVMLGRPFRPPKKTVLVPGGVARDNVADETTAVPTVAPAPAEPWSREAFDLFEWRPPGWDEDSWCLRE